MICGYNYYLLYFYDFLRSLEKKGKQYIFKACSVLTFLLFLVLLTEFSPVYGSYFLLSMYSNVFIGFYIDFMSLLLLCDRLSGQSSLFLSHSSAGCKSDVSC